MPEQTYNIGYGTNDFFYDKKNTELLKTIPFSKESLLIWVNKKLADPNKITSAVDIFDPKITSVVFLPENKDDFIDTYLRDNIVVDKQFDPATPNFSNYNPREVNLDKPPSGVGSTYNTGIQSGTVTLETSNQQAPILNFDLVAEGSNINYTTNSSYNVNQDISLNTVLNSNAQTPYTEPNGSTSYISVNTANPRCKFQKSCTENHWHYKSCTTQTIVNTDGTTYCRCVCNGPKTLDNTEHQHCSPFNIGTDIRSTDGSIDQTAFQASIASLIEKISIAFKKKQDDYIPPSGNTNMSFPYKQYNQFTNDDLTIRTLIYNYYYELNRNIQLRNLIISNDSLDNTAAQKLLDANVQYKKEYLHLFNIFSGILFASGYIYVMYKSKPE
jgi:hypothetical protein